MAEFVTTHRGGKVLHYQGYIYTKIRDGKEGITDGDARITRVAVLLSWDRD